MTNISPRARFGAVALLLAGTATLPAAAQTGNTTVPQTLPGLDNFSLPSSRPTPVPTPTPVPVIVPTATPTPAASATPRPRATPTPQATPTPRATPTPVETATPAPSPTATTTPVATPTLAPAPVVTPTPAPTAVSTTPSADNGWGDGWTIGAVLVAIAGGAGLWWWRRRRPDETDDREEPVPVAAVPRPVPAPAPPVLPDPAPVVGERGRLTLALSPRRAGLNLLSATVEAELLVRNDGSAPAAAIRIGAALIGAAAGQGGDVAPLFAQPVVRPATPPFALAPGEERRVRLVVALPRTDIAPLAAGGRAMFVPVVAVNALYEVGTDVPGQSAAAFAVGVERVDSAKLAPFWLDQPARMHEQLGVRPYGTAIER
ncbi:hypothetical protein M9979_02595 [Sphingomonas sp. RP10(2022)]|uniref:LPXTG-motif cell wall anchor domain-containing protein n=1 Tax=Sphingomonas liriopis TaxID=2949094 RepID=A0A9X2HXC1_9SPHN|nr:hypothetical protein [Sphingomonas liriopis]MCP3733770.1 hypothetical protein [Sphingomonas liriopis]